MVRYLILSDLHANWEALDAIVQYTRGWYDEVLCCGDLVGYGADPNAVVEWARANCSVCVRGNHDRACTGLDDLEWFNPVARVAAVWTQKHLTPENASWTRDLVKGPVLLDGFQVVHGSPFDEDEYVVAPDGAGQAFGYLERRLAFFGHTHLQGGFIWNQSRIETIARPSPDTDRHVIEIDGECGYLVNPGSAGQPRDGDPRAACALYDPGASMLTYLRIEYDVDTAAKKITDAGLPPFLAERLSLGR